MTEHINETVRLIHEKMVMESTGMRAPPIIRAVEYLDKCFESKYKTARFMLRSMNAWPGRRTYLAMRRYATPTQYYKF